MVLQEISRGWVILGSTWLERLTQDREQYRDTVVH